MGHLRPPTRKLCPQNVGPEVSLTLGKAAVTSEMLKALTGHEWDILEKEEGTSCWHELYEGRPKQGPRNSGLEEPCKSGVHQAFLWHLDKIATFSGIL